MSRLRTITQDGLSNTGYKDLLFNLERRLGIHAFWFLSACTYTSISHGTAKPNKTFYRLHHLSNFYEQTKEFM